MPLLFGNTASSGLASFDAFESLFTAVGNGSTTQFDFTIPQTFKHLHARVFVRTSYASGPDTCYTFAYNGASTSTNSSYHAFTFDGSNPVAVNGTGSFSGVNFLVPGSGQTAGVFGAGFIDILDYSVSGKQKTVRAFGGYDANGSGAMGIYGSTPLALGTSPVTAISFIFNAAPVVGSYICIYGVK